jgi:putative MATE family efflux protein
LLEILVTSTTQPPSTVQQRGVLRPLLHLLWPVLAEQLLVMLVGFSDTLLAGHYLSETHLASMTVVSYGVWLLTELFSFIAIGALAVTARYIGAGDRLTAGRVADQSLLLGAVLAVIFTTLGLYFSDAFAPAMQLEGEAAALATRYYRILIPLLPMMMLEAVGIDCLRAAGDMLTPLVSMIVVNAVNICVSWVLLTGAGPFPELGWDGLAIGTACGHFFGGAIPLFVLLGGRSGIQVDVRRWRPDFALMRRILRIGVPGGIDVLSIVLLQLVFLSIVSSLSTDELAAHGVAVRIESIAYLPGYAFQVAIATLCGQYLGAKDYARARRAVTVASAVNCGLLTAAGMVMFFAGRPMVWLFVSPEQAGVVAIAPVLLRIVAFAMPPFALLEVFTGALRGAGDTRWPLLFTLIGFVGVRLPLAWLFVYQWQLGVEGAWYAMVTDVLVRCALISARFWFGGWQRVRV